jgi:hypothetical protein
MVLLQGGQGPLGYHLIVIERLQGYSWHLLDNGLPKHPGFGSFDLYWTHQNADRLGGVV